MTELRDQFAMAALTGMLTNVDPKEFFDSSRVDFEDLAVDSYRIADAMLAARAPAPEPIVDDLDLSVRAANLLESMGIRTIAQLRKTTREDFVKAKASAKTIKEIFETSWAAGWVVGPPK